MRTPIGTTVEEGGIIYVHLRDAINEGLVSFAREKSKQLRGAGHDQGSDVVVTPHEINAFHGAQKTAGE